MHYMIIKNRQIVEWIDSTCVITKSDKGRVVELDNKEFNLISVFRGDLELARETLERLEVFVDIAEIYNVTKKKGE